MKLKKSIKYGLSPDEIEQRSLANEHFKTVFNMYRIERTQGLLRRLDDYNKKKCSAKKKKLTEDLSIDGKVYVLAERIKKKSAPGKFYKQFVQNMSYFNKDKFSQKFPFHKIPETDCIQLPLYLVQIVAGSNYLKFR